MGSFIFPTTPGSQLEVSEANATLTITVPANNTSSTRSGKVVLIQQASGKTITINLSQTTSIQNNGIIIYVYSDPSTQGKGVIQVMADHPIGLPLVPIVMVLLPLKKETFSFRFLRRYTYRTYTGQ